MDVYNITISGLSESHSIYSVTSEGDPNFRNHLFHIFIFIIFNFFCIYRICLSLVAVIAIDDSCLQWCKQQARASIQDVYQSGTICKCLDKCNKLNDYVKDVYRIWYKSICFFSLSPSLSLILSPSLSLQRRQFYWNWCRSKIDRRNTPTHFWSQVWIKQGRKLGIRCVSQVSERRRYGPTDGRTDRQTHL